MTSYTIDHTWDSTLTFRANNISHQVFRKGDPANPGVVLMHELPGMSPECICLAEEIIKEGFRVYLPLFFGKPGHTNMAGNFVRICIRREFHFLANHSSGPITDWLRALCDLAHEECNGRGVGAIGMCLTGGFALSMMVNPSPVMAPVLSQPSLPIVMIPFLQDKEEVHRSFGVSQEGISATKEWALEQKVSNPDFTLPIFRFAEDPLCPQAKIDSLREQVGTEMIVPDEGADGRISTISQAQREAAGIPEDKTHSVLTGYSGNGQDDDPTEIARKQVIEYLKEQLV
ncbi:MAG: dienelactone hydrolase family protein [Chloroflexota bacterium]